MYNKNNKCIQSQYQKKRNTTRRLNVTQDTKSFINAINAGVFDVMYLDLRLKLLSCALTHTFS